MLKCNNDCWNCELEGCPNITLEEYKMQDQFDKETIKERIDKKDYYKKYKDRIRRYDRLKYLKNKDKIIQRNMEWANNHIEAKRRISAKSEWKKRFIASHNRPPKDFELVRWEEEYNKKKERKKA